jgi:hypothetical protein
MDFKQRELLRKLKESQTDNLGMFERTPEELIPEEEQIVNQKNQETVNKQTDSVLLDSLKQRFVEEPDDLRRQLILRKMTELQSR